MASSRAVLDGAAAQKLSVNVSADVGEQLKRAAFSNRVSESSIVEIALRHLFERVPEGRMGLFLRQRGACLRRAL